MKRKGHGRMHEIRERKSRFIDILRKTPTNTVCPNFFILAHANGCAFQPQCQYCYLKSSLWFLGKPLVFGNTARMLKEVRRWIARNRLECYMLNTGNLSDSLSFEAVRPLMSGLVDLFRKHAKGRKHSLLMVTKGGMRECRYLFRDEPCENVIISFSVNHPAAARALERGAATPADRLKAAARLKELGWRVRIRIDPMIYGYDYGATIRRIRHLRPERVTLGSLRAEPNLLKRQRKLFSEMEVPAQPHALARYPLEKRLELYRPAVDGLKDICPIGLCEEWPSVWKTLGLDTDLKQCNCNL